MLNSLVSRAAIKSRSRAVAVKRERNNLLNEVAELKRKLMETAFEREKMLNALILCSDALLVSTTALPEDREMVLQAQQAARKAIGNE